MNLRPFLTVLTILAGFTAAHAQSPTPVAAIVVGGNASLMLPEGGGATPGAAAARDATGRFFETYLKLGQPRLLFVVNAEAAARPPQPRFTRRGPGAGERSREARLPGGMATAFVASGAPAAPSAAEPPLVATHLARQFDQPFREGGARLADPTAVATLMAGKSLTHFTASGSEAARRDRAALAQVADVIVEVVVAQREVVLPVGAAERVGWQPEVQATAIRLSDSAIIGQANSRELVNRQRGRKNRAGAADTVEALAQATAQALMESIARHAAQ